MEIVVIVVLLVVVAVLGYMVWGGRDAKSASGGVIKKTGKAMGKAAAAMEKTGGSMQK